MVILANYVEHDRRGYSIAQFAVESKSSKIGPVDFGHGRDDDAVKERLMHDSLMGKTIDCII